VILQVQLSFVVNLPNIFLVWPSNFSLKHLSEEGLQFITTTTTPWYIVRLSRFQGPCITQWFMLIIFLFRVWVGGGGEGGMPVARSRDPGSIYMTHTLTPTSSLRTSLIARTGA
jgi:hypothetical protein